MESTVEMEAGIPPPQRVIYLRAGEPLRYWFGRTIFVADEDKNLHYVLLAAASSSLSGNGQFFSVEGPLWVLAVVLGISVLWWWPFVRHITRPLKAMTEAAERIAAGDYAGLGDEKSPGCVVAAPGRRDEIGRLSQAVSTMAEQVRRQMLGQRRFIRHIAHELGSPLARIKLGLAVLDSRLEGDARDRINQVSAEVEQLSVLVGDVLTFLRAESAPQPPEPRAVPLCQLLGYVVEREVQDKDVQVFVDGELAAWADVDCLRRAVANVVRNAVRYTGPDGRIVIEARRAGSQVVLEVSDNGPGVEEHELPHLMEPFYRGSTAASHPGGSGLGLSIVKHCVEACGGSVTCQNMKPAGFAVSMRFPATGPKPLN
jgi:two-component system sensor histidine kinase CpxA